MLTANLQTVADQVVRQARRQGYVVPREVREELARVGLADTLWKEVLLLTQPPLARRFGRYYYPVQASEPVRQAQAQQDDVRRAVRRLIRDHKAAAARVERRGQDRLDFIQPVKVRAEDNSEFTLLSRDLSSSGIRLVGTRRLLGHKLRVTIPQVEAGPPYHFVVRILWTCAVGDDLFENGGNFLAVEEQHETE
jgi:hypothetical protein